ncbi:hypothetical protein GGX14DRAFT_469520 [Mycena pura]|uniref:MYND-type domain-containing protein n=1 Tax=Mycena pura TaxID=153505 RepID=A0AAD6UZZ9_9AGAR|nr:hypothetical protein GGX14DRAFT_469520 [Mycena pura]
MNHHYTNKTVAECTYLPCTNTKTEYGGRLRACGGCSVAGKGVAIYCSIQCQKADWPRHKIQCKQDQEDKSSMPEGAKATIEEMVIWDRKNRSKLITAAISALDLCHHPENADEFVFFVGLADAPGAKHRFVVDFAMPLSFDRYESIYGQHAGDPRNDQRIGQERAKQKSATCISFQIVEFAVRNGCRNTFQTWMLPKDMHGYRTVGFVVPNWHEVLLASCAWPKVRVPENRTVYQRFDKNTLALKAWRDMHLDEIYSAAIDALSLDEDILGGQQQFLILYLRCTGLQEIAELVHVVNAFVFSLEEAETMFIEPLRSAVKSVVNGRPRSGTRAATDPAPCVVCQIIDPVNPTRAPAFTVPVKVTEALLQGTRRKYSWKDHLVEMLGAGDLRPNLVGLEVPELEGLFL